MLKIPAVSTQMCAELLTFCNERYVESLPLERDSSSKALSFSAESLLLECR